MDELPVEFAEYLQSNMDISVNANLINVIKLVKNGVTYAVNSIYVLDQGFSTYGPWPSSGPHWFF